MRNTGAMPVGLPVLKTGSDATNKYQYNGKENTGVADDTETGWQDYGARMYMPEIGRFGTIDPLAEKYYSISPFNYSLNGPIMFNDFDGRNIDPSQLDKIGQQALLAFYRTKLGKAFLGQYAVGGKEYNIGGQKITFKNSGIRAKDKLIFRSSIIQSSSDAVHEISSIYLKNDPEYRGNGLEPREIRSATKNSRIENGVGQVITLDPGHNVNGQMMTIGHEAFVHKQKMLRSLVEFDNQVGSKQLIPGNLSYIDK